MPKKSELLENLERTRHEVYALTLEVSQLEKRFESMKARAVQAEHEKSSAVTELFYWMALTNSEPRLEKLLARDRLIRWLAMPWGENDPQFPVTTVVTDEEGNGLGTETRINTDLRDTWNEVVRYKSEPKGEEREGGGDAPAPQERG